MISNIDKLDKLNKRKFITARSGNTKEYISAWLEDDVIIGTKKITKALVVILRTAGCSWARTAVNGVNHQNRETSETTNGRSFISGGCFMCGYINDCLQPNITISSEDIIQQFRSALNKFKENKYEMVKIFTSGSFFDNDELPAKAQKEILTICDRQGISEVLVESRPDFITLKKLQELTSGFSGQLTVAIGLESANDVVLKTAINKGFPFEDYCKAVNNAKELGVKVKTYLLLKPIFLTEHDAILDTLNSIRILVEKELTDCISINPVHIQNFTIVEYLFNHNDYRPPWLWSVVEVLKQGHKILTGSDIRLLSQPTAGGLRRGPHNCGICDKTVLQAIAEFSIKNDPKVFTGLVCDCRKTWSDGLKLENLVQSSVMPTVQANH